MSPSNPNRLPIRPQVSFVGAGPGAADLITLRGLNRLRRAEVVLHDSLAGDSLLAEVPATALLIYVGKRKGQHSMSQPDICSLLVAQAATGARVVRLKGGDCAVFGRLTEEVEALRAAGCSFEIVPGVTAASACASVAGIPLTDRHLAHGVSFVTAHRADDVIDLGWHKLLQAGQTLVVYMGLSRLGVICERLLAAGISPELPALLVANAGQPQCSVLASCLLELPAHSRRHRSTGPATLIFGAVAAGAAATATATATGQQLQSITPTNQQRSVA